MWSRKTIIILIYSSFLAITCNYNAFANEGVLLPSPIDDRIKNNSSIEHAIFAGGCFWGVQGVFQHVKGVIKATSGYAGGEARAANYDSVSTGSTGHAESVQVDFDPTKIGYGELLRIFFSVAHDPTQLNRQGPDLGSQYRSVIFYVNNEQQEVAKKYIEQLNKGKFFNKPIVTELTKLNEFFPAESYHQDYLKNHPFDSYIIRNDMPKISRLKKLYPEAYQ